MDLKTFLLGFVVAVLVIGVLVFGAVVFYIWKKKVPLRGAAALIAAVIYLISPIDVIPEALTGPIGLLDDAGVLTVAFMYAQHLLRARQAGLPLSTGLYSGSRAMLERRKPVNRRQP